MERREEKGEAGAGVADARRALAELPFADLTRRKDVD